LLPGLGEELADVDSVVVLLPVFPSHPPVTVVLEGVVQTVTQVLVLIPSLIFVLETALPFSVAPRISNANQLKAHLFQVFNPFETISVVKQDTLRTVSIVRGTIFIFLAVSTSN
jgi:hypothetical protein